MNSVLRGTAANVEAWERWPTDKTVQQLGDVSGDKLLSLSSPLSSMSTCCAELSGDTPFYWACSKSKINDDRDGDEM